MWNTKAVLGGTSIAVLTYIGFDGISTLSEEAENPRRNILLATVLTCLVIGILSAFEVYAGQLIWPASEPFPNVDAAFTFVAARAWKPLLAIVGFTLLVANFGSGMGSQLGAARLLYGMGRSNALPKSFFGAVDPKRHVPRNNVIFVGVMALGAALLVNYGVFSYGLGAEMLNFGALIAFMGVNAAAFVRYDVRESTKPVTRILAPALTLVVIALALWGGTVAWMLAGVAWAVLALIAPPMAGFVICFLLWWNLSRPAKVAGTVWMVVGIAFGAWKTRGFRGNLVDFELPPEES
jgi:amino acid transporter